MSDETKETEAQVKGPAEGQGKGLLMPTLLQPKAKPVELRR